MKLFQKLTLPVAWIITLLFTCVLPWKALGGVVEISAGGSYNRSSYTDGNYSWTRRWGGSVGYHLTELSQIEIGFQDVFERTRIGGYEDTTFHDQIFSANWVQSLLGKGSPIQPYGKVGIGQLNREASGNYALGGAPPIIFDSVTGILGAGIRLYLTRTFVLRGEATTYLTGGNIGTWQDNFAFTTGISILF